MIQPHISAHNAVITTAAADTSFTIFIIGCVVLWIMLHRFSIAVLNNSAINTAAVFTITTNHSSLLILKINAQLIVTNAQNNSILTFRSCTSV